ncbi:hypothetical protein QTP86_020281 [Hemibagrus guttatus]|nr:hypothetical protein QTP86_020281 [Hemibagrus guttatus]
MRGSNPDLRGAACSSTLCHSEIQRNSKTNEKKVIEIYQSGKGYKAVSKALGLPQHGTVENLPRSGRPTKITPRAQRQLIQEVRKDPTTTSKELQASLASVKVSVHDSTIRKRLGKNGLHGRVPRQRPLLSKKNIKARLSFARKHLDDPKTFGNILCGLTRQKCNALEEDQTEQHGFKQQSTRPTLRSGRNLAAGSCRTSGSRSDITRCHFCKHHHRFFCAAVPAWLGSSLGRVPLVLEFSRNPVLSWFCGPLQGGIRETLLGSLVGEELCRLQQGKLTVPEYALQFRTLAAKSCWNEQALLAAYCQGLNPQVRLHLAAYEDAIGLERLIQLSIRVAARMQLCVDEPQDQSSHNTWSDRPAPVSSPEPAPEPMHLGTSYLTPA